MVWHLATRPLTGLHNVLADRDALLQRVVVQLGVGLCQRFCQLAQDDQPILQTFELLAGRLAPVICEALGHGMSRSKPLSTSVFVMDFPGVVVCLAIDEPVLGALQHITGQRI